MNTVVQAANPSVIRRFCRPSYVQGIRTGTAGLDLASVNQRWFEGDLVVKQRSDGALARVVMVARLVGPAGQDVMPELVDAELLSVGPDVMEFIGYERDSLTRRDTAQGWIYTGARLDRFHCQLIRHEGAPKPRWVQTQGKWHHGRLVVADEPDEIRGRWAPVARFWGARHDTETVQPLLASKLIYLMNDRLVLTGFNRHPQTGVEVAQTWLLIRENRVPDGAGEILSAT